MNEIVDKNEKFRDWQSGQKNKFRVVCVLWLGIGKGMCVFEIQSCCKKGSFYCKYYSIMINQLLIINIINGIIS